MRNLIGYTDEKFEFTDAQKQILIKAINDCRILDPACGSGAFPMGMLQRMIHILKKLDPENKVWLDMVVANFPEYMQHEMRKKLEVENWDYVRKIGIIQECIYGVDIQPIATQISKLRFFISLLVDQKEKPNKPNRGFDPLPNLDFKLVTANTLIAPPETDEVTTGLFAGTEDAFYKEFEKLTARYFSTYKHDEKKKVREEIEKLTSNKCSEKIKQIENLTKAHDEKTRKALQERYKDRIANKENEIALWESYKNFFKQEAVRFFDVKYFFPNVKDGFDIVIGNPPYISIANLPTKVSNELSKQQNYDTFSRGADLYCLFYERGMKLLMSKGILAYISSNRFCFTNYGDGLREYLSQRNILELINFNEINVFESANVGSVVVVIQNAKPDNNPILIFEAKGEDAAAKIQVEKKYSSKEYYQKEQWSFDENHIQKLKKTIESKGVPFIQWKGITINRGITTGANNVFIIDEKQRRELIKEDASSTEILLPVLRGANIKRFFITKPNQYLVYTYSGIKIQNYPAVYSYLKKHRAELEEVYEAKHGQKKWFELRTCSYYDKFAMKKLVWTRLANQNAFSISLNGEFTVDSSSFAVGENLEYLSSILNSKVVFFYFKLGSVIWGKDGIKWFGKYFDNIPIPEISKEEQKPFVILVDKILSAKEKNPEADTSQLEKQLDEMVYKLYELTEEEIKIIEGN